MTDLDELNYNAFLNGDNQGFEELIRRYKNQLIFFLNQYVNDFYAAEDLAQDVFVEILLRKKRFQYRSSFKTYLFAIGRHKAIDYIRKHHRVELMSEMEKKEEETLEDIVVKRDDLRRLMKAMKELKQEYREVILLVDFEELSYKEAAAVLHKTLPQIKVLLHRGRKQLGIIMERREPYEK